ncbi:NADP-dependent glyceraldehyde-3-phosphate dehydrogenase [Clostridium sp. OS1-26]|uniref:NADP-dependent glyceraldehyde-3-phosphate dehydrogenase n=1 Tax=Clostridium sp. OS1-26 TaxID=3070681 RepID=UPI0027E191A4|nr:NADP-dependent glyceraldehyde-3-phosphate dehydrogenase [Clostridium sp. OS1-26]WML36861.1 NADP-dependent glyceraldehyde-3-phosphate dehydrogenase [Clostridium sp. OS1-26]
MFENIKEGIVYKNLFNGEWIKSISESTIDVYSPVNGDVIGKVQSMTKDEIDKTIENSKRSQKNWAEKPINERAAILHKCANLLEENISVLSDFLQKEIAKNKSSAISEVKRTSSFIRFTADEAKHMEGETITGDNFPGFKKNKISVVHRVPLGTVLAISPFNYPINLSVSKIAPALAAGNSVILKPPSQGSISALYVAEIFNKAGIPKGVLNTVTGKGSEIGDYIVTHPEIDFINFTGSTDVGKHIAVIAGMVPMLMELGGKDAAIVLEDSDLRDSAKDIVAGAYIYSGQRCTAIKRVLAINNISDELAALMLEEIKKLKVGMPEDDCEVTPLINNSAADFVQELIDDALDKGAKLVIGNKREKNLMYPTLLDNVTTDMRIAWEEPFGPVLPILRVQSVEEAIEIANKSQYGLQSSVFTKNIDYAFHVASKLEVGTVQINDKTERGPDHFPFLGVKASGMGTQGIRYSIEAMSRKKVIVLNIHEFS